MEINFTRSRCVEHEQNINPTPSGNAFFWIFITVPLCSVLPLVLQPAQFYPSIVHTVYDMWAPLSHVGPTLSPFPCSQIDFCPKSRPSLPEDAGDSASRTTAALHPAPPPLCIPRCCLPLPATSPLAAARCIACALVRPHHPGQPSSGTVTSASLAPWSGPAILCDAQVGRSQAGRVPAAGLVHPRPVRTTRGSRGVPDQHADCGLVRPNDSRAGLSQEGRVRPARPPLTSTLGRLWPPASRGADRPGRGGRHRRPMPLLLVCAASLCYSAAFGSTLAVVPRFGNLVQSTSSFITATSGMWIVDLNFCIFLA
jgi:hypothetical protein